LVHFPRIIIAERAQRLYYQSMNNAEKAESRSATAQWTMD